MLRTRLLIGTLLAAGAGAVLVFDPAPWYPGLAVLAVMLGVLASFEFVSLFPSAVRPRRMIVIPAVLAVLAANWVSPGDWLPVVVAFAGTILVVAVVELVDYRGDGTATPRLATATFAIVYLGLLPSFLIRLRWFPDEVALTAIALTIFVPKCGDIGAYFTGRLLGRHPFAPTLSPKKTWEGVGGGLVTSAATAVGLSFSAPVFRYGLAEAVGFGLVIGAAGIAGDLLESLLKRDAGVKDASARVPGFGGILDVIDSILFAAPLAFLWFTLAR